MFEWDDDNREHVRRHGVEPEEAEEVLDDPGARLLDVHTVGGEWRATMIGVTASGRRLIVVVTPRGAATRVVTAYPLRPRRRDDC